MISHILQNAFHKEKLDWSNHWLSASTCPQYHCYSVYIPFYVHHNFSKTSVSMTPDSSRYNNAHILVPVPVRVTSTPSQSTYSEHCAKQYSSEYVFSDSRRVLYRLSLFVGDPYMLSVIIGNVQRNFQIQEISDRKRKNRRTDRIRIRSLYYHFAKWKSIGSIVWKMNCYKSSDNGRRTLEQPSFTCEQRGRLIIEFFEKSLQ